MATTLAEIKVRVQARQDLPPPAMRKALREAAGVSLRDAAAAAGVSYEALRLWEMGAAFPTPRNLVAYVELLRAFGLPGEST
jgi:transcriptional regulator with XRE-family HTH domain